MAIETSFTIKQISVDQALQEAENKVDRSARKMDKSLDDAGSNAGKAISSAMGQASKGMDAVSKAGGKIAGVFKNATGAIMGMTNPIGIISAGITAAIALIVKMYETAQEKIQSLIHTSEWKVQRSSERVSNLEKEQETDRGYMKRLVEINRYENVDNATKQESARIISLLTAKYGDLGLSIDATTGKIIGLTEAMAKQNQIQLDQQMVAVSEEYFDRATLLKNIERGITGRVTELPLRFTKKLTPENITTLFGNPQSIKERFEEIGAFSSIGAGGHVPERTLYNQRAEEAQRRYRLWNGDVSQSDNQLYLQLQSKIDALKKLAEDVNLDEGLRQSYKNESVYLQEFLKSLAKIQVAQEMINAYADDDKMAKKWEEEYQAVYKYYMTVDKLIQVERKRRPTSKDPNDANIKMYGEEAQKLLKSLDQARKDLATSIERKYLAENQLGQVGMTKAQLRGEQVNEYHNYSDQINRENESLKQLREEYDKLISAQKEFDQYKDENGDIADKEKNAEYLRISNEIMENKLEQLETERKIINAETEQLSIQAKIKAYDLEAANAAKEKLKEYLKTMLRDSLGDTKETTNDLTRRGGYLSNVNTINPLQVNRQILNTVITANNYLSAIKVAINNAGRI